MVDAEYDRYAQHAHDEKTQHAVLAAFIYQPWMQPLPGLIPEMVTIFASLK